MGIMIIVKYSSDKEVKMEDMFTGVVDDGVVNDFFLNDLYVKALEIWLPFLEERGYLEKSA
jgi:hypothetical protein